LAHLNWATWHFQDIALQRTRGASAFGNEGVRYRIDPAARARFAADTDPTGRIRLPVLATHGIGDATAFVELQHAFRETMRAAGRADSLVQTYVDQAEHSYLGDTTYPPLFEALLNWVERGDKPTPAGIAQRCTALAQRDGWGGGCRFVPGYEPAPLASRVPAR
jgi:alpha-beta hydrolase superfamily lysophospholipase